MKQNKYNLIIIAHIFFIFGYFFQNNFSQNKIPKNIDENKFSLFWEVWNILEEKYPFEEPSESDKRYESIKGLVSAYDDPYTSFFPPENSQLFKESINGEFAGIGVEISIKEGFLVVIAPLKDSPAEKAGIQAGDIITSIDNIDISNNTINQVVSRIRGEVDTDVIISVFRIESSESIDIPITRAIIDIPISNVKIIDGVFVISLYNFNRNSEKEFRERLEEFKESGLKYLLIDLYNNPGGFLSSSVDISSYFIDQGKIIVTETFGDSGNEDKIHRSKGYDLLKGVDYKLGVLINKGSASASEIVAGALQDHNKALIIGEKSYGKGSIQEVINFDQDTSLRVTVGKWLTPKGIHISKQGISPDKEIENMQNFSPFIKTAVKILKEN